MHYKKRDTFAEVLLLMSIYGANSGPTQMPIWEWEWEEGDTTELLDRSAEELAAKVEAWIDDASEDSAADDRIAIQVVLMCKEKTLKYTFVSSTFEEWDYLDELVMTLQELKPQPYAPLVLIKVLTEQMVRDLGKSESNGLNSVKDADSEKISESVKSPLSLSLAICAYQPDPIGFQAWGAAARVAGGESHAIVRHLFLQRVELDASDALHALNQLDAFLGSPTWLPVALKRKS
jgi:hypothetical protein